MVLRQRPDQRRDPLPVLGADQDHRHRPARGAGRLLGQCRAQIVLGAAGDQPEVGLGHHGDVRDFGDARLQVLQAVARAGLDTESHAVAHRRNLGLGLADAHRLDQHEVVDRAHQHHGRGRQRRQPAEAAAARHGAHEHARVLRRDLQARAIAEQRATRAPRGRIDRDHAHGALLCPIGRDQPRHEAGFADPRGPGDADHVCARAAVGGIEQGERLSFARRGLDPGERARHRPLAAGAQSVQRIWSRRAQSGAATVPRAASAACAAARRAIGTR